MSDSRISGLYRLGVQERIDELQRRGWLSAADAEQLRQGRVTLSPGKADRMVENVFGVFGLPLAIAPNFIVNGREYIVPMVVEEPSVVAAVSMAALLARETGGFTSTSRESLLIGQVHVSEIDNIDAALERISAATKELVAQCNAVHPRLAERGGGVTDVEARGLDLGNGANAIAVHILVDTCDAMGANLVNKICEAVAPRIVEICGGRVALRILSNLADRSLVSASVSYRLDDDVRDDIVLASKIASADPYRAATHNKGIMNGIDALAIATGNDWRAIEAGAHAYAATTGTYGPLATWTVGDNGALVGEMNLPLKVGTVGGNLDANAGAAFGLGICGASSARELAELMAAVGLAQNFAALRALATSGIQEGHMKLHARSVASSAGVPDECFTEVVAELIASGEIKVWKAQELVRKKQQVFETDEADGVAAGKVILLGEHAVVYGKHALAVPIQNAVSATLRDESNEPTVSIPELEPVFALIKKRLGIADSRYSVHVTSRLPIAMGLGSSAAFAVAVTRAFNTKLALGFDDEAINKVAFECEKLAHGTPSGVDNSIATYGEAMLFRNTGQLEVQTVAAAPDLPLVVACSSRGGLTREQVAGVRTRHKHNEEQYEAIFAQIDGLSLAGADALANRDYDALGRLMNICHGLLTAIEVSTPELESMASLARAAGAAGAKMTGGGGGGSIVALCPGCVDEVGGALRAAGFNTVSLV